MGVGDICPSIIKHFVFFAVGRGGDIVAIAAEEMIVTCPADEVIRPAVAVEAVFAPEKPRICIRAFPMCGKFC